jgi:hypothetical protein
LKAGCPEKEKEIGSLIGASQVYNSSYLTAYYLKTCFEENVRKTGRVIVIGG